MSYTPYTPQTWNASSYVTPTAMNHIESGIKSNSDGITSLNNDLTNNHYTKSESDSKFATNSDLANIQSVASSYLGEFAYTDSGLITLANTIYPLLTNGRISFFSCLLTGFDYPMVIAQKQNGYAHIKVVVVGCIYTLFSGDSVNWTIHKYTPIS